MSVHTAYKDPGSDLDYGFDWTEWLDGDTLTAVSWTVPSGLTGHASSFTDTQAVIWISGGTAGNVYSVVCRITTTAGRVDERTLSIVCREK